jgi:hypothetical protein
MEIRKKYDVISPDGFSISFDKTYGTIEEAKSAFIEWKKRYESQGYYSSNYGRIPLNELEENCRFVEL